jgi:hypothetical protein
LASEKRYVVYGTRDDGKGNKVVDEKVEASPVAPRSFLFAINSKYGGIDSLETALKECTEQNGAHVHGLAVMPWWKEPPQHPPPEWHRSDDVPFPDYRTVGVVVPRALAF